MNEAETRAELIDPKLKACGWGVVEGSKVLCCSLPMVPGTKLKKGHNLATVKRWKRWNGNSPQVAIEALKERETLAELSVRFDVHATIISKWKQEFLSRSSQVFEKVQEETETRIDTDKLYSKIGQLEMENDFLKKSLHKLGR